MKDRMARPIRRIDRTKTLNATRPNAGLEALYRRRLDQQIDAMHRSIDYWLRAAYRSNPPEMAADASPARSLRTVFNRLARRWQRHFDEMATKMGEYFGKTAFERADGAMADILKQAGWSVEFQMTKAANDVYQALIAENVGLIRNVSQQYLTQIEGHVMRSVQAGRDLHTLAKELETTYGMTKRRAALIARDQNNKATAIITRVRQQELGITQAVWQHSHAGRQPRPEHVAFDGHTYEVAKGAYLEGKWTWPGVEINCRCTSKPVIPGFS